METMEQATQASAASGGYAIAFEPVAEAQSGKIFAYEALLRSRDGRDLSEEIAGFDLDRRRALDRKFRKAAVLGAAALGLGSTATRLVIRLQLDTIEDPIEDQQAMIETAFAHGITPSRLILRVEAPESYPSSVIADLLAAHAKLGCLTMYGPFHGSDEEFTRLSRMQPDLLALDAAEVRGLASSWSRRLHAENLVRRIQNSAHSVRLLACGVDNEADVSKLVGLGVRYVAGPIVGAPEIGSLPASLLVHEMRKSA